MKISTDDYHLVQVSFSEYQLINRNTSTEIVAYNLSILKGSIYDKIVDTHVVMPNETHSIKLEEEGFYELEVMRAVDLGPPPIIESNFYSIRYLPTLKSDILRTMRDAICDCLNMDNKDSISCSKGLNTNPMAKNFYELQALYSSVGIFRDILLSPSFRRAYDCCLTDVIDEKLGSVYNLVNEVYNHLALNGDFENSHHLVRMYTSYLYIIFYAIEVDSSLFNSTGSGTGDDGGGDIGGEKPPVEDELPGDEDISPMSAFFKSAREGSPTDFYINSYDSELTRSIKEMYDIVSVSKCMARLGIEAESIFVDFLECYRKNEFGKCQSQGEGEFDPGDGDGDDDLPPGDARIGSLKINNDPGRYIEIGQSYTPDVFTWSVIEGTPKNLQLSDDMAGNMDSIPVTGTSYDTQGQFTYNFNTKTTLKWYLEGSNTNRLVKLLDWMHPVYWGLLTNSSWPTESQIVTANNKYVGNVQDEFTFEPNSTTQQYVWVAVPVVESALYNRYLNADKPDLFDGAIMPSQPPNGNNLQYRALPDGKPEEFLVNGVPYYIYKTFYPTAIDYRLKLYSAK